MSYLGDMEVEFENSFDPVSLTPPSEHLRSQVTLLHRVTDSIPHVNDPKTQMDFGHGKTTSSTGATKTRRKTLLRWSTQKKIVEVSLGGSEHSVEVKWRWNETQLRKESESSDFWKLESKKSQ